MTKKLAIAAIFISSLLWSTAGLSAKILLQAADPLVIAFFRFALASIIILPFFLYKLKTIKIDLKKMLLISLVGCLNVPLFYIGLKTTTANSAQLIYAGCPLVTVIFSYFLIGERTGAAKFTGIIIGLFGVLLIIFLPAWQNNGIVIGDMAGNMIIATGMILWSLYTVLCKANFSANKISPLTITSMYFFVSTLVALISAILLKQDLTINWVIKPLYFWLLIYSAVFVTVITYFLYQWVIQIISVTTASLKNYLEPLFAIWLNILILKEMINPGFIFATILILTGITFSLDLKTRINPSKKK